jgi:hypothetical protein
MVTNISPADHRYLLLGWILGKLTAEDVPYENFKPSLFRLAKALGMSEPTRDEMQQIGAFLKYVNELYQVRHPHDN